VFIRLHPFDSRRPLRAGRGELVSPRTPYLIQLSSGSALVTVFRTPRGGETLAENGTATRWLCPLSASLGWSVTLGLCCCVVAAYTFERAKRGFFRLNGLTTSRRCGILCLKRCVALNGARTACGVYGQTGEEFFCKTKPVCHNGLQGWALRRIFYFGRPRDGVWVQNSGASGERRNRTNTSRVTRAVDRRLRTLRVRQEPPWRCGFFSRESLRDICGLRGEISGPWHGWSFRREVPGRQSPRRSFLIS